MRFFHKIVIGFCIAKILRISFMCKSSLHVRGLLAVDYRDNNLLGNLHAVSAIAALHLHGGNKRLSRGNFVVAVVCITTIKCAYA